MPPKVIQRPERGVLPVNPSARAPRAPAARLKLEIRRLPPSLTLTEFEETLGEEWKLGSGKVDWREYRSGKVRSPGKIPDQSRCYVHLKSEQFVREFEQRFLNVVFHDQAGSHKHPELKHLQPSLGYAANQRTPLNARTRGDNRQGTIDQDPEFIAFLEAETQPITKPAAIDHSLEKEKEVIKSTPLIDDLREKKANKAKAAASKADKDKKTGSKSDNKDTDKGRKDSKKPGKPKEEPAANPKVSTKQGAKQKEAQTVGEEGKTPPTGPGKKGPQSKTAKAAPARSATPQPEKTLAGTPGQRQRQPRNNLDGIKKQLQKDLGVKAPQQTSKANPSTPAAASIPASAPAAPIAQAIPPTGPKASRPGSSAEVSKTKAYLKHANPSQGMTEILIQQALAAHGEMVNVTIDPRKGTAIAVFKDNEGLKKALEAKKVTVANGAVEVLEFKELGERGGRSAPGGRGGFRGHRGGRGGSRGAGNAGNAAASPPAPLAAS